MKDPSLGMKEIAAARGFQNSDYFRAAFRKSMGKPPQTFRSEIFQSSAE